MPKGYLMLLDKVIKAFNSEFAPLNTRLVGGYDEPFYLAGPPSEIRFREDFLRSALHEVAHWCIAGAERRKQDDFGYWYCPDGRDQAQQQAFEQVEIRPQAIEAEFCQAIGIAFRPSQDNLNGDVSADPAFEHAINALRQSWQAGQAKPPVRATQFINRLRQV